tara:strand:+ start:465 stop:656 length:192 start_codon:yes stop_codon:yes gene_type:complete
LIIDFEIKITANKKNINEKNKKESKKISLELNSFLKVKRKVNIPMQIKNKYNIGVDEPIQTSR